jgi:hypothetical protein
MSPRVSVQVGDRVRIDCNYEDYKSWERVLRAALHGDFKEETTLGDGYYWKSMSFKIGETEYRVGGPVMPREKATNDEKTKEWAMMICLNLSVHGAGNQLAHRTVIALAVGSRNGKTASKW